jgi:hypothetical protein
MPVVDGVCLVRLICGLRVAVLTGWIPGVGLELLAAGNGGKNSDDGG